MTDPVIKQRTFLGHPGVMAMLFFTEMWERVSYYGMRAILVLYMVKGLHFEEANAYSIYGACTGLIYMTPLIGGMIADRFLGNQRAIMVGCFLMALGNFVLMVPNELFFFAALGIIVIGNGYFKANMSTVVGKLYEKDDPRRDGAFTLFYMGVNLGAFIAPFSCGVIGELFGWNYGFAAAGIGMLFGLILFTKFKKHLGDRGLAPRPEAFKEPLFAGLSKRTVWIVGTILSIPLAAALVSQANWVKIIVPVCGIIFLIYIVFEAMRSTPKERGQIFTILILTIFSISFWACFEQAGTSITIFTDKCIDRSVGAITVPITLFQSINPFFIIILGIPFSMIWTYLGKTRFNPSSPLKMALGILQLAAGFFVLVLAAKTAATSGKASLWFLVLGYFLHTTGELCLSPVGLSMVSKLSPTRFAALLMGAWLLSASFANIIGGAIAGFTEGAAGYDGVFMVIVKAAVVVAILLIIITPLLKKMVGQKF